MKNAIELATLPFQDRLAGFIKLEREHLSLLIYPAGKGYPIEYSRMDTPEKVLAWVYHLVKKENVTKGHLRAFLEAAKRRGVNFPHL